MEQLEESKDLTIAVPVLCAEFYDNRTISVNERINLRINFSRYLSKKCTFEEQRANRIKELFNDIGIELTDVEALNKFEYYLFNYEASWSAYDDVRSTLEQLNSCKLGIISNGDYQQQVLKLRKIGVEKYFCDIVTAEEYGVSKPNIELFQIACKNNNVRPEECYYVGDEVRTDILPCK
ncbi:MAG: HAD family hydrolase [Cellulosilyticum sp.]|nr:HAD family hydrolase [Cellulosilyticum sp.]